MRLQESQTIEFKEAWSSEHLKTVCAFANTNGGALYIGVSDSGEVVGVKDVKSLVETLPNQVMSAFVISVDVEVLEEGGKPYVKVTVPKSGAALSYRGKFYTRSGSTTQELKGGALQKLLLRANNLSWDEVGVDNVGFDDIDNETVSRFVTRATTYNRLPTNIDSSNVRQLFQNLELLTDDGELTRAAVLLFGKRPTRIFRCATFQIGRFKGTDPTALIVQDVVDGNLLTMFNQVIDHLKSKYLLSPISYMGMQRVETLEIPDKAIREAVLNAIIHKDYTSPTAVSLRVYDPTVSIWNAGELENLRVEDLSREHISHKRNPLIANIFYRAGYIEAWGRGTLMIIDETSKSGLPRPTFEARQGGLIVTFQRDWGRLVDEERRDKPDFKLSERQKKAVDYVRKNGSISNSVYQEIADVSKRTAIRDLTMLVACHALEKSGSTGRSTKYVLPEQ